MKIGVTFPVYITNDQHQKYLDLMTSSIVSSEHDLIVIPVENFVKNPPISYKLPHEPEDIFICKGKQPQTVAGAWNVGIRRAQEAQCDYVLVVNTDIIFKSNMIDRLVEFAKLRNEAVMWTASEYPDPAMLEECPEDENYSEHPHFSCFLVNPNILDLVGEFDENFIPGYMEDNDYAWRMVQKGLKAYIYGGAKFYHFGSRTIKSDMEAWDSNNKTFPKNQQYFLEKWGHPAVNDVERMKEVYYQTPFNK